MIPLDLWNSEEMSARRRNAVAKALKEKPEVVFLADRSTTHDQLYEVKGKYTARVYTDADGQRFVECQCRANTAPIDEATGLPKYESVPCFHLASVLLFIAEKEDRNCVHSSRTDRAN